MLVYVDFTGDVQCKNNDRLVKISNFTPSSEALIRAWASSFNVYERFVVWRDKGIYYNAALKALE